MDLIQSPIVGECQTENDAIKEELTAVCESQDDIIKPKEEYLSDAPENLENSFSDTFASDSEDDVPVMEYKIEVEEHEVLEKIPKPVDEIKEEQTEFEQSDVTVNDNPQNCTLSIVMKFKEPLPYTTPRVTNSSLDINCQNDSNIEDSKCKIFNKVIDSDDKNRHPRVCVQEKLIKCGICQRSFMKKSNLTQHIRTHVKAYKCEICQCSFAKKDQLTNHIRTHTGERPFKCNVCQLCFIKKCSLTRHIRIHTGEKPYKCEVCQRCFSVKIHLKHHIHTHTGEKPYKCYICQRCFSQKCNLTKHIRIHTGEKRYKCDVCQECFMTKTKLNKHIGTHPDDKKAH